MLREVKTPQRLPRMLAFRLNTTAPTELEGIYQAAVTKNGTGDVTITFAKPFARLPVAVAASEVANCYVEHGATPTAAAIRLVQKTNAGVATDGIMDVIVLGFDAVDQI